MANYLLSLIVGALVGWVASLITRTPTSEAIALDIGVGALGALVGALLLGRNSFIDAMSASYVGSALFLLVRHWARHRTFRSPPRARSKPSAAAPKPRKPRSKPAKTARARKGKKAA